MSDYSTIYQASPDGAIKAKMEEHIQEILNKPSISNDDYELLKQKRAEVSAGASNGMDWFWPIIMMVLSTGFGGVKK